MKGVNELLELLISYGANVNAQSHDGRSALMQAADSGQLGAAAFLLKHGADVNAKGSDGETALMLAEKKGYTEIAGLLREHGAGQL